MLKLRADYQVLPAVVDRVVAEDGCVVLKSTYDAGTEVFISVLVVVAAAEAAPGPQNQSQKSTLDSVNKSEENL